MTFEQFATMNRSTLHGQLCIFAWTYPLDVWLSGGRWIKPGTVGMIIGYSQPKSYTEAAAILDRYNYDELLRGVDDDDERKMEEFDLSVAWFKNEELYPFANEIKTFEPASLDVIDVKSHTHHEWWVNHSQVILLKDLTDEDRVNLGISAENYARLIHLSTCINH